MAARICGNCGRTCAPQQWRQARCSTCWMWRRRHGTERPPVVAKPAPPVDDGRREVYVAESYGAGWYVRAAGQWWQVPAYERGWRRRRPVPALAADGRRLSAHGEAVTLRWLAVPAAVGAVA